MSYTYDAGTSTPNLAGLVEFNGIRINDGTFELHHLAGLIDSAPIRIPMMSHPAHHGGFIGTRFYDPLTIGIEGKLWVADYTQIGPAVDQLRGAFNTDAGLQTLTVNYPGWANARQVTAGVSGQIIVEEPVDLEKLVPERNFTIPLIAPDPLLYDINTTTVTVTTGTTVTNTGNASTPFTVRFTGAATNPTLTYNPTGTQIAMGSYSVASGHYAEITTNAAATTGITALTDTGTNVYGSITAFTAYLIPPGSSSWTYTGGGTCTVTFRNAWA